MHLLGTLQQKGNYEDATGILYGLLQNCGSRAFIRSCENNPSVADYWRRNSFAKDSCFPAYVRTVSTPCDREIRFFGNAETPRPSPLGPGSFYSISPSRLRIYLRAEQNHECNKNQGFNQLRRPRIAL